LDNNAIKESEFYFVKFSGTGFVLENIVTRVFRFYFVKGWVRNVGDREPGFGPENSAIREFTFYFAQFFERAIGKNIVM